MSGRLCRGDGWGGRLPRISRGSFRGPARSQSRLSRPALRRWPPGAGRLALFLADRNLPDPRLTLGLTRPRYLALTKIDAQESFFNWKRKKMEAELAITREVFLNLCFKFKVDEIAQRIPGSLAPDLPQFLPFYVCVCVCLCFFLKYLKISHSQYSP